MDRRETDLDRVIQGTLLGEAALTAEVAVLLANEDGQYIAANDEALRLTGYARSDLTNAWMGFLSGDESSRTLFQRISRLQELHGKKVVKRRDGEIVHCGYWAIPARITGISYFLLLLWPNGSALAGG
ncbi:MAG TPA: PAS domain-containing protein [Gemmatimonadaceae bacterium]|nr:PAS domain-containing protein [Gemmatimonadaceae bacterium]